MVFSRYQVFLNLKQFGEAEFEAEANLVPCIHSVLQICLIGLK